MPQIEFLAREERPQPRGDQPHRILSHFGALSSAHFAGRGRTRDVRPRLRQVHRHPVAASGGRNVAAVDAPARLQDMSADHARL